MDGNGTASVEGVENAEMVGSIYKHEKRNLALVISGRFESIFGAAALMVAMPLYILDLTKSGTIMGLVSVLQLLPRLFTLPFGGVLGDRVNRKWWMVSIDELRGMILLIMWVTAVANRLSLPILFVFISALSILDGLFSGPTGAMFGDVVRKENMKLATSLNSASHALANIIGPIVGGALYGFYGFKNVLLFTGILYIFSGITEMFIIYKHTPKKSELKFFKEIGEGINFVWKNKGLKFLFTFAIVINFIASPLFMVVFPYFARVMFKFSSSQYGMLQMFGTVGALIGNLSIIFFLKKVSSKKLIATGLLVQSALLVLFSTIIMPFFGLTSKFVYLINAATIFLVGFFNILVNVPINANLQILVPSNYRSRVFSVLEFLSICMVPISSFFYGYLIDKVSPFLFFLSINVVTLFISLVFVFTAPEEAYEPTKHHELSELSELNKLNESSNQAIK